MSEANVNQLFQHSTMGALVGAQFAGSITFADLLKQGDIGIGTLHDFDGELVVIDGEAYQIKSNGQAYLKEPEETTPFASVSHFEPSLSFEVSGGMTRLEIEAKIRAYAEISPNIFFAVKLTGTFKSVDTRVVPKQMRPYQPLVEAVKKQPVFHFENVKGTVLGFWTPPYFQGVGVAGYHLHFITAERDAGGHLFAYDMLEGTVELAPQTAFKLQVPQTTEYYEADLNNPNMVSDIEEAEN
ncbi:acetolactate decarboxylase [Brochothrix campestris]|uniref:acetolactate decarboxylase n=1 Tax=Brochothrix campestris TaxID=2757 RepID=UPI0038CFEA15